MLAVHTTPPEPNLFRGSITGTGRRSRGRRMSRELLWILVGVALVVSALINVTVTDFSASSETQSTALQKTALQEKALSEASWITRPYLLGFFATAVMLACARRAGNRLARFWRSPLFWAAAYQSIITFHFLADGNIWDATRICGGWLLLVVAMALSPPMPAERYFFKMRGILRLLLWLACAAALLRPQAAFHTDYTDSFLPGVTFRFAGIGGHANGMGMIAATAILFEMYGLSKFSRGRTLGVLYLLFSLTQLVLTQSKTALMACFVCSMYLLAHASGPRSSRVLQRVFVSVGALIMCGGALIFLGDWLAQNARSVSTFTGRTAVWELYWQMAWEKPWFGYGPGLWSELRNNATFQYKYAAGNAHNQLLNSFLMAGLIGVVCWFAYVWALARRSKISESVRPLYTSILLMLLIRCITEAGLEPGDPTNLQIVLLGWWFCEKQKVSRALVRIDQDFHGFRRRRREAPVPSLDCDSPGLRTG
jgi:O-antigen ligase